MGSFALAVFILTITLGPAVLTLAGVGFWMEKWLVVFIRVVRRVSSCLFGCDIGPGCTDHG